MNSSYARGAAALAAIALGLVSACSADSPGDPETTAVIVDPPQTTDEPAPSDAPTTETAQPEDTGQAPPAGAVVIGDRQEHRVIDAATAVVHCEGLGDVYVTAHELEVTITGTCDDIEISANGVTVSAEVVEDLDIAGHGNTVTATRAGDLGIDGNDNVVTIDEVVREIDVEGHGNTVTFTTGSPQVDDDGNGNQINQG